MTVSPERPGPLLIRKYSNRRFYDTSRSCNVTLDELHKLVGDGWDLKISDAKTEEDLTNSVLTQLILDHHAAKLVVFPAAILHQIIRTQQQFLGGIVEQFFREALAAQRSNQEQWSRFMQNTLGAAMPPAGMPSPFDWMRNFMGSPASSPTAESGELDTLRRQLSELQKRLDAAIPPAGESRDNSGR